MKDDLYVDVRYVLSCKGTYVGAGTYAEMAEALKRLNEPGSCQGTHKITLEAWRDGAWRETREHVR